MWTMDTRVIGADDNPTNQPVRTQHPIVGEKHVTLASCGTRSKKRNSRRAREAADTVRSVYGSPEDGASFISPRSGIYKWGRGGSSL